jgi:hypothetical protein
MVADFMTKALQGSHFRRLHDLIMGMSSIKKAKIPSKSTVTETKRDGRIKVRALERSLTAVGLATSVNQKNVLAEINFG